MIQKFTWSEKRKWSLFFIITTTWIRKKIKLVVIEFIDYVIILWEQLVLSKRRNHDKPINTWDQIKAIIRRRFVLSHYYQDLYKKLKSLTRGYKSVEDHLKEIDVAMIQVNVYENKEATMARFLNGLNHGITNVVELQHYVNLEDMVHMDTKVE